eukprot:GEZU01026373.1.p1 GENE.GEZU01026373.1~~GEZU01026373.1.p1  ORF type:complete len:513 (-),score=90.99 GEZU01026373.1:53-1591(-)
MKYTIFTIIAALLVIILGLTLRFGDPSMINKSTWIGYMQNSQAYIDKALGFMVACLALVGLVVWNIYAAYGLAYLPMCLIMSRRRTSLHRDDLEADLSVIREEMKSIQAKYNLTGRDMTRHDQKAMDRLKRKEKVLTFQISQASGASSGSGFVAKLRGFLSSTVGYAFKILLGLVILAFVIFVLVSLFIGILDGALFSPCKFSCGFIATKSRIFNPLDKLLVVSSQVFPADYIFFVVFITIVLLGAIAGVSNIGVRIFCFRLYKLTPRKTVPQGLLTSCVILMFIVVVFSVQMTSFVPQYATFGTQTVYDPTQNRMVPCTMDYLGKANNTQPIANATLSSVLALNSETSINPLKTTCQLSELAKLKTGISVNIKVFSLILYFSNWLFFGSFVIGLLIAIFQRRKQISDAYVLQQDEDDIEDYLEDELDRDSRPIKKNRSKKKEPAGGHAKDFLAQYERNRAGAASTSASISSYNSEDSDNENPFYGSSRSRYGANTSSTASKYSKRRNAENV